MEADGSSQNHKGSGCEKSGHLCGQRQPAREMARGCSMLLKLSAKLGAGSAHPNKRLFWSTARFPCHREADDRGSTNCNSSANQQLEPESIKNKQHVVGTWPEIVKTGSYITTNLINVYSINFDKWALLITNGNLKSGAIKMFFSAKWLPALPLTNRPQLVATFSSHVQLTNEADLFRYTRNEWWWFDLSKALQWLPELSHQPPDGLILINHWCNSWFSSNKIFAKHESSEGSAAMICWQNATRNSSAISDVFRAGNGS